MRIIGPYSDRNEIELDPAQAYRRARALDALLRSTRLRMKRCVYRGTAEQYNRIDKARMIEAARLLRR